MSEPLGEHNGSCPRRRVLGFLSSTKEAQVAGKKAKEAPPPKRLGGRPPFVPTKEQRITVEMMASFGIPQDDIAKVLGISKPTLREHFREELDVGKARTITKVAASLVRQALAGNVTAMIFYLKCQAGWRESPQALEHSGPNGTPLVPILNVYSSNQPRSSSETD